MTNDDEACAPDAGQQPLPACSIHPQRGSAPQTGHNFASFRDEVQAAMSHLRAVFAAADSSGQDPDYESLRGLPGER